jgi:hypothetical protein
MRNPTASSRNSLWTPFALMALLIAAFALGTPEAAVAGTCAGGVDAGRFCNFDSDCRKTCAGGIDAGRACSSVLDCRKTCAGGIDAGKACSSNLDCRKTCAGGVNSGQACTSNANCPGSSCLSTSCLGTSCLGTTCIRSFAPLASSVGAGDLWFLDEGLCLD